MGDIATHKEIVLHMIPQLTQISPAENYTYIEFGNFLTDISQFRDPVSFLNAKGTVTAGGFISHPLLCGLLSGFLGSGNLRGWADAVFGTATAENKRHGKLPEFFRLLGRAVSHIKFSAGSKHRHKDLTPLSATEVDRVFNAAFTQYYPHEHVDYPPTAQARKPERGPNYVPSSTGLMKYLENHIQFVSEELSKIEYAWLQNRALPADDPVRCDLLVRLGHVLHAVEDFYFHSNAVELRQWRRVAKQHTDKDPAKPADYHFLVDNILDGSGHDVTSVRLRRLLARRLRYPKPADPFEPTPLIGDQQLVTRLAVDFAYTGGFGGTDISHTIAGGLSALEESFQLNSPDALTMFQGSGIPLLQALFSETERNAMAASCQNVQEKFALHTTQVNSVLYPAVFLGFETNGDLTAEAREAFVAAWALDGEVATQFPGKPGPGGFLLLWLRRAQKEVNDSHAVSDGLDADTSSPYDTFVGNGASGELVGTHSLMAKDGVDKDPLRRQAMALAKSASAALAVMLRQRIEDDPNPARGLDWNGLVRHFMRIPPGRANSWEEEVLTAVDGGSDVPPFSSLQDKPTLTMLEGGVLDARRGGPSQSKGEALYRALEK